EDLLRPSGAGPDCRTPARPGPRPWTAEADAPVRTLPAREVVQRTRRTAYARRRMRGALDGRAGRELTGVGLRRLPHRIVADAVSPTIEPEPVQKVFEFRPRSRGQHLQGGQPEDGQADGRFEGHDRVPRVFGDEQRVACFHTRVQAVR